jgi:predicted O-linked N-acetylglucosamine transferase (SPINDLY family)
VRDLPQLRTGKADLQREVLASRLFDGADLTHHLEQAFTRMLAEKGGAMPCPAPGF